jgi:hypothetical protein
MVANHIMKEEKTLFAQINRAMKKYSTKDNHSIII